MRLLVPVRTQEDLENKLKVMIEWNNRPELRPLPPGGHLDKLFFDPKVVRVKGDTRAVTAVIVRGRGQRETSDLALLRRTPLSKLPEEWKALSFRWFWSEPATPHYCDTVRALGGTLVQSAFLVTEELPEDVV